MRSAWVAVVLVVVSVAVLLLVPRPHWKWPVFKLGPSSNDLIIADATKTIDAPNVSSADRVSAYYRRAVAYRRTGLPLKAESDYRMILKFEVPGSADYDDIDRELIETYTDARDYAHAMAEWEAYAAAPDHEYAAFLVRAKIHRGMHDGKAELADLSAAIAFNPRVTPAYLERAQYYLRHDDPDRAARDLDAAQKIDPDAAEIHAARIQVASQKDDFGALWREFKILYGAAKAQGETALLEARAQRESDALEFGLAIADYTALIARNPQSAFYRDQRADLYLWHGDAARAYADYHKAIDTEPTRPEPYLALAKAYGSQFRFEEAWPAFKNAVVYSDGPAPHRVRAFTEMEANRNDDAAADFIAALKLDPGDIYSVIGLHRARLRQHQDDRGEFAGNAAAITFKRWPAPILDYQRGLITRAQLATAIDKAEGNDTVAQRHCEVDYTIGIAAFDRGDRAAALPPLQSAAKLCHPAFLERSMAAWALKQAGIGS